MTSGQAYAEVIGDPIAQSKSPAIHNYWLKRLGIDAEYRACHVTADGLADYVADRRDDPNWRGCNVTMPHKQAIVPLLDQAFAMWTSHVAAGPSHGFSDLPIIIAGNAGGYLKTGQYINANGAGNNKLLNTLITAAGVPKQDFGQGTGGLIDAMHT